MGKLDIRHKEAIRHFFREFLELFFPDLAARIRFDSVRFLDKELLALRGSRAAKDPDRRADALVLAEVQLEEASEWILVHWEQQSRREPDFEKRMFRMFCGIYFRYGRLVFPVALFTDRAKWRRPVADTLKMELLGRSIVEYRYHLIKLSHFEAAEFQLLAEKNPLAAAYLPLTTYDQRRRPEIAAAAHRAIARLVRESAGQATLFSLVDYSLNLDAAEERAYYELVREDPEWKEVKMLKSMEEYGFEKGLERGLEQGLDQGLERGLEQGLEQGLERGLERGLEQGSQDTRLDIARRLVAEEQPLEMILRVTGLSRADLIEAGIISDSA